ncbi:Gfo/Idh/MocA family oxidoreductase [Poritiphilus flavus]|uniref:Gfo/Idh/MocA family oxidoreductase n=1 Tax=Poritiphilus flavus TaxID=2697053 RepID=A0A6L9EG40_9FLAO|nr:Gfo/Idh/MocA family oxidoreductase [Poritiphilus flavus]NAS13592.1 Gfo/Idh/MocA family oxidoreductase [Poritiphilus flavus]
MLNHLNFAIIGLGRAGRFHLASLEQLNTCRLKYIVDPNIDHADQIVSRHEYTLLPNIDAVLEDPELDAVIISTPTHFHFDHICKALKAGKHVFTEKPLGKSVKDITICYELARKRQLALHLGFQRRYDKNFIELKDSIGGIGQVRTVKISSRDNPKPSLEYLKISGNIFHDMLIHDFDMLQFLFGYKVPESVFAFGHAYDPEIEKLNDFDSVLVTLKYPDGLLCSIDTSRTAVYGYDQRIELFAENGMAIAENERNNTVEVHKKEGTFRNPINYSFNLRYQEAYRKEIAEFIDGIRNNELFNIPKDQCLLAHLIADAAYDSCVGNTLIDFQEKYASVLSAE